MKKEQVLKSLQDSGFILDEEKSIQYGIQLVFRNGAKVIVYHRGTVLPQGKHIELVNKLLGLNAPNIQAQSDNPEDHF